MSKLLIFVALFVMLFSVNFAHAQHHGGQAAPPISFGDRKVTVSTWLDPADFNPEKDTTATLHVRFYDSDTNTNIERVTYRVQIFSGDALLASQMFFNKAGELLVQVQPSSECAEKEIWRCTKYEGNKDPVVPSALESTPTSIPIIRGPLFDKPGPYAVKVAIIGATNPKTQTTQDIDFETNINIAQEQQFPLSGKTQVTVRSFQDDLTNFQFTESTKMMSFDMPFHWDHAEHVSMVRNDFEIPKSFPPFQGVSAFKATINGIPIYAKDVTLDTYSDKNTNTLHFAIVGEELKMLEPKITDKHVMSVQIMPDSGVVLKSADIKFPNGYKATISYDPRYGPSKDVPFTIAFFDSSGVLAKDIRYAYSVQDSGGKEFVVNTGNGGTAIGISVPSGADSRLITIPSKGTYTLQMYLVGRGLIDFDQYVPASLKFDITEMASAPEIKQGQEKTSAKTDTAKLNVKKTEIKSDKKDTKKVTTKDTKKTTKTDTKKDTKPTAKKTNNEPKTIKPKTNPK